MRFETMPSSPMPQAWRRMTAPVSGDCLAELNAVVFALLLRDSTFASLFLRSSSGSGRMMS
jgi:hypothetical protein